MNWGIKIFGAYGLFVGLIIFMVSLTMRQNIDLVSTDYYDKELAFQEQIDKTNNSETLDEKVEWIINDKEIKVYIPGKASSLKGTITFFRPSDSTKDLSFDIDSNTDYQSFDINKLTKGLYKMQVDWESNEKKFYQEQVIIIP